MRSARAEVIPSRGGNVTPTPERSSSVSFVVGRAYASAERDMGDKLSREASCRRLSNEV